MTELMNNRIKAKAKVKIKAEPGLMGLSQIEEIDQLTAPLRHSGTLYSGTDGLND